MQGFREGPMDAVLGGHTFRFPAFKNQRPLEAFRETRCGPLYHLSHRTDRDGAVSTPRHGEGYFNQNFAHRDGE